MNKQRSGPVRRALVPTLRTIALAYACSLATEIFAQQVLVTPPTVPPPSPPAPEAITPSPPSIADTNPPVSTTFTGTTPVGSTATAPQRLPFQWGPISLHPHLSYQLASVSGLQSSTNQAHRSIVQTLGLGVGINLGRFWQLDYTPTLIFYSDRNFRDVVDHAILLSGAATYEDWAFNLSQSCTLSSDPLTETASQTDQQSYSTALGAHYQMNSEMFVDLGVSQDFRIAPGFQNSRVWSTMDWINRSWGRHVSAGLGAGVGYVDVDLGNDMTFEPVQARILWRVANKLSLSANAGVDIRQFIASGTNGAPPDLITPTFGLSLAYQPFENTSISVSANRSVSASYFQNQVTEGTMLNASISQRFFGRFNLGLSGGYANNSYSSSLSGLSVNREDNYYFLSTSVGVSFLKRGLASVFYSRSSNTSTANGFGYNSDQFGFQVAYRY